MTVRKPLYLDTATGTHVTITSPDTIDPSVVSGGAGLGDVSGPASSTDEGLARYDGAGGKTLQASGVTVDDSNNLTVPGNIAVTGTVDGRDVATDGTKLDTLAAARQIPAGGTGGQVLKKVDGTDYNTEWDDDLTGGGGGGGDVSGPGAATDNRAVRWDGATGTAVQDSPVTIGDTGDVSGVGALSMSGNLTVTGTVDGRDVSTDGAALDAHTAAASPHSGHLTGPASVVDNKVPRYDGTTGKILQDSLVVVDDLGNVTGVKNLTISGDIVLESGEITAPGGIDIAGSIDVGATTTTGLLVVESTSTLGGNVAVTGSITVSGNVDGRDVSVDGAALDAHTAAAAPHSGHATDAELATVASDLATHAALTDPHSGALPRSGARAMTGDLDMGSQDITSVKTVDGRDVSADGENISTAGAFIDEETRWPEIKFQCAGEWVVGTDTSTFEDVESRVMRVSTTNATWTLATRTLNKTNAFSTYTFEAGDTWIPSTTDGGWTAGTEYVIESQTDVSNIVLVSVGGLPADNAISDGSAGRSIDTTNNRLPYDEHRFVDGEAVQFLGGGRPSVAAPYGPTGGAGVVTNLAEFFAKQYDDNTIEVYGSRELDAGTKVDFTSQGTSWSLRRRVPHYREENFGGWQVYNTIGAPVDTDTARFVSDERYQDQGFDVFPYELSMGGGLRGEITGILKQRGAETRNLYLVIDMDPDVRAHGATGCNLFKATCVAATKIWTKVAHGLKNLDIVQAESDNAADFATTLPVASGTNLYVRRIDADTFYLCTDPTLKAIVTPSGDSQACITKPSNGNWNRIRFAFAVPNTVSDFTTHTVTNASWVDNGDETGALTNTGAFTNYLFEDGDQYEPTSIDAATVAVSDASWVLGTLTLTKAGAFTSYTHTAGDTYEPTSTDGGWTVGLQYPIASRTDADNIVLTDPDTTAPANHGAVGDGVIHGADGGWVVGDRLTVASRTSDDAIVLNNDGSTFPATHGAYADGILYSATYTPFKLTWEFERDEGNLDVLTASKCGIWHATLEIGPNGYGVDPATPADGYVARQKFSKTIPRTAITYAEQRQQEFGPVSKIHCYATSARPTFTFAVDEAITGGTSGATGVVIRHDPNSETITYRPDSIDTDFIAGETITGVSGSLTAGPIERGPIPIRFATRLATSNAQDDRFEVRAHSYRVTLFRNKLG